MPGGKKVVGGGSTGAAPTAAAVPSGVRRLETSEGASAQRDDEPGLWACIFLMTGMVTTTSKEGMCHLGHRFSLMSQHIEAVRYVINETATTAQ